MNATPGAEFFREIDQANSVLIGTHLNPDGDALGSALALSLYLDGRKIDNEILCHHAAPSNLKFLPGVCRVKREPSAEKYSLGVLLDLDSMDRLGSVEPFFAGCERLAVVDHHVPHEAPGDVRIIDTSAPATALILTRLLFEAQANVTPQIATCLLTGIVTDTGSFRFRNTTPEALALSASLIEHGADLNLVSDEIFQRKPLSSVRLLGLMLEGMSLTPDERIAWGVLGLAEFEAAGAADEDTEGFVNEMLAIDTVQISTLIREPKPGKVRASLRSRGDFDVAAVARDFGGGGHRNAAGCNFDLPLDEAVAKLIERLKVCLASS